MTTDLTFVSHLRRGFVRAIADVDPLSGPLPSAPTVEASLSVKGRSVFQQIGLQGAAQVTSLAAGQITRSEPQPNSTDVEPNYFPFVEVAAPDLPWLMTPAAPDTLGRLRPWMVLVVVRRQPGVEISVRSTTELRVLTIESPAIPANELPDLTDSWAWAHVQAAVPPGEIDAAAEAGEPSVIARLICPRRLEPRASYHACLLPAFEQGRLRGLGQTPEPAENLAPAWDASAWPAAIELPIYHSFDFTTGAAGDFEALARRLKPDAEEAVMGLHALDVGNPGLVPPSKKTVILDMEGALLTLNAVSRPWSAEHRQVFEAAMTPLIDAALSQPAVVVRDPDHYDPLTDDPVLTPPAYGGGPAGVVSLPEVGWLRDANLHPVARAMAGLGAAVVRANQEELVAAAWDQAGDLPTAVSAVNQARLAAEVGESWARRVRALEDADVAQVTRVLHPLMTAGATSVRESIATSGVPAGIFSAASVRLTRPGTPLWRDWRSRTGRADARLVADHGSTLLAATATGADPTIQAALQFADYFVPSGAQTSDPTLDLGSLASRVDLSTRELAEFEAILAQRLQPFGITRSASGRAAARNPVRSASTRSSVTRSAMTRTAMQVSDISGIAATVRNELNCYAAARASVVSRIPALEGTLIADELPSRFTVTPRFDDALYWDLLKLGAEWILPGVDELDENRARLVAVNLEFVGAFLIAANTELGRELRWRDYPIDMTGTYFRRFWHYVLDPERMDIGDLDSWAPKSTIEANMEAFGDTMTAIVVRGDLIRRYPTAHWFLQPAVLGTDNQWGPGGGQTVEVSFLGSLDARTAVFGFDLEPDVVRGDRAAGIGGYYVGVEEQPSAPRFGLDTAKRAHFGGALPASTNDLSWGHLADSQAALDELTHARATGTRLDGHDMNGTIWGRNSAHMAEATWQRPFRALIHADLLI